MVPSLHDFFLMRTNCPSSHKNVCRCLIGEIRRPGPPINERPRNGMGELQDGWARRSGTHLQGLHELDEGRDGHHQNPLGAHSFEKNIG